MFTPHVVLLDIRMPGIDGHTVLDHLRGSPQPPTIIIVSGNHEENEARQLLQRGAFDYVTEARRLGLSEAGDRCCCADPSPPFPDVLLVALSVHHQAVMTDDLVVADNDGIAEVAALFGHWLGSEC